MVQNIERGISGVYLIQCIENGKNYIGSAKCIRTRWKRHITDLKKCRHHSLTLQEDWIQYGEDKFNFTLLIECKWADAKKYEIEYIEKFKSDKFGYNSYDVTDNLKRKENLFNKLMLQYVVKYGFKADGKLYEFDMFDMAKSLNVSVLDILNHFRVNKMGQWNTYQEVEDSIYIGISWDNDCGLIIVAYDEEWLKSA